MFSLQLGKNISPVKQMFFPNWEIIRHSVCVFRAKLTRNKSGQLENRKRQPDYKNQAAFLLCRDRCCYLATRSSHFTMASMTPMEIRQTIRKIAQQ